MTEKRHSQRKGYTIIKSFSLDFKALNIIENHNKYNCKNQSSFINKAIHFFYERNKNINERIDELKLQKKQLIINANEIAAEINRLEDAVALSKKNQKSEDST